MALIHNLVGRELVEGDVGIEIEVEGENLPDVDNTDWLSVADGSLRNGMEYVTKRPLVLSKVKEKMIKLNASFEKAKSKLSFSLRTSVHVHVNVGHLDTNQFKTLLLLSHLFEPILFNKCKESRKCNRFCLGIDNAAVQVFNLADVMRNMRNVNNFREGDIRYAAVNLAATKKFGSLEYRMLHGTADVEEIVAWTNLLVNLRETAIKIGTPTALMDIYNNDIEALMNTLPAYTRYSGDWIDVTKQGTYVYEAFKGYRNEEKTEGVPLPKGEQVFKAPVRPARLQTTEIRFNWEDLQMPVAR